VQAEDNPIDTRGANTTAVSLTNNVGLPLLMAGMHYRTNSWLECLQDTGALLKRPVRCLSISAALWLAQQPHACHV
jgi:hypothetical protein